MSERSTGGLPGRVLASSAVVSLIAFAALTAVVTHHGFDGADDVARALVHRPSYPALRSSMEAASFLGGQPGQIVVVCLASVLIWRRRRRWGFALPVIMAGAGLLQHVMKWAVDRPRPNLDPWGFPSGHTLTVVVLFGYIAYVLATSGLRRRFVLAAWAGIVATVAFSRMYLDAHFLSDVLGGFTIGLAYLLGVIWLLVALPARGRARPAPALAATVEPAVDPIVAAPAPS